MNKPSKMKRIPSQGGEPTVTEEALVELKAEVPDWRVVEQDGVKRLRRVFKFEDFAQALAFTNRVGEMAEEEGHHPVLVTEWGKVTVTWWTHKIGGLHQNDFAMAAKTDRLYTDR
ncbi:MAG: 4a-hydroxytetrahydrobiopterin dehydratase [Anaerolineae bacterium]|jgi:4a-hydroxytetrahydrobiopterin dehydratase